MTTKWLPKARISVLIPDVVSIFHMESGCDHPGAWGSQKKTKNGQGFFPKQLQKIRKFMFMWFFPVVGSRMMATLFAFRTTAKRRNVVSESDYQTPRPGASKLQLLLLCSS